MTVVRNLLCFHWSCKERSTAAPFWMLMKESIACNHLPLVLTCILRRCMSPAWHFGKPAFSSESSETLYLHLWSWNNRFDWWWCHWQKPDCKCMKSMHHWALFLYSWRGDECNQVAVSRVLDAFPLHFVFWWDTCSLDLYAGCSICISCVALVWLCSPFSIPRSRRLWRWSGQASTFPEISSMLHQVECLHYFCSLLMEMEWS